MVLSIRDLRLALDSRRVRRVVCACAATAPLATDIASNTPATCFTLNLKPNINDYSCTSLALLWWNSRAAGLKPAGLYLIRTSAEHYSGPYLERSASRWRKKAAAAVLAKSFSVFSSALLSLP